MILAINKERVHNFVWICAAKIKWNANGIFRKTPTVCIIKYTKTMYGSRSAYPTMRKSNAAYRV